MRFTIGLLCALCVLSQQAAAASDPTTHACSVLTRAEVRNVMPWSDQMERIFPQEEEDQFANGSGCEYPSVRVQIMTTSPDQWKRWVDASKNATVERVAGVGEEAYIRDNKGMFAELYAKSGSYLVSLQKSLKPGETTQASKAQLIALGKALVAKLRSSPMQQGPALKAGASAGTRQVCASCGSSKDPFRDPWSNDPPGSSGESQSPSASRSNSSALADLEGRIRDLENAAYFEVVSPKTGNTIFRVGPGGARFFNEREEPVAAVGTTDSGGYFSGRSPSGGEASIGAASARAGVRILDGKVPRIDLGTKQGPFGLRFPSGEGLIAGIGESRAGSGAVLVGRSPDGGTEGSIVVSDARAVVSMTKAAAQGGVAFAEARIGGGLLDVATVTGVSAVKMGHNDQRYGIVLAGPALGFPYVPRSGLPGSYFMGCASGEKPACLPEVAQQ